MNEKILIVDDDKEFLEELETMLELSGYDVLKTDDGNSAVMIAQAEKPDIIVLDIRMPSYSGFEVANRIRNLPETSQTPMIIMTASDTDESDLFAMRYCGIMRCLKKPIKPLELIVEIERNLKEPGEKNG